MAKTTGLRVSLLCAIENEPLEVARARDLVALNFEHHEFSRSALEMRSEKGDKIEIIASRSESRFNRSRNEHLQRRCAVLSR